MSTKIRLNLIWNLFFYFTKEFLVSGCGNHTEMFLGQLYTRRTNKNAKLGTLIFLTYVFIRNLAQIGENWTFSLTSSLNRMVEKSCWCYVKTKNTDGCSFLRRIEWVHFHRIAPSNFGVVSVFLRYCRNEYRNSFEFDLKFVFLFYERVWGFWLWEPCNNDSRTILHNMHP